MEIVAGDIGGTHARFALARVEGGKVVSLGEPAVLRAREHEGLKSAWAAFGAMIDHPLPRQAAVAIAAPVGIGPVGFANSDWVVDPATVASELGLDGALLLNDFGAMAHAVHALPAESFVHLCGPDEPLPDPGTITVVGAGTGLGVAALQRQPNGGVAFLETEGGHIPFSPIGEAQRRVFDFVSTRHARVSVERIVSGPGLCEIVRSAAPDDSRDDAALWASAIEGQEPLTREALAVFLECYGAVVGDLSLAHGSLGIALTGGLTNRFRHLLDDSGFHAAFCRKGRFKARQGGIPIKLVTHPQPGLFGAAAAFALEHA